VEVLRGDLTVNVTLAREEIIVTNLNDFHVREWQPAPRPEWVRGIIEEGKAIDSRSVVPLDEASLIGWAQANTGLTDFGSDEWYPPFSMFLKSIDEEADLHLLGRIMARAEILNLLESRLKIEQEFKDNPEIEDEEIVRPIVIIGQGRSGTSALLNLLDKDPRFGTFSTWETTFPVPPPNAETYCTDPRIAAADRFIKSWVRVTPEVGSMHEFGGDVPQECTKVLALTFMSIGWLGVVAQTPSYARFLEQCDHRKAYAYQRRVMKLLQWKNPRQHWVLKSPVHLDYLPELLSVFPDACLVWPHRDPLKALASVVSLMSTLFWGRSDDPKKPEVYDFLTRLEPAAARLDRAIEWIESGQVPKERLCNIRYSQIVEDPVGAARVICEYFGIGLPEQSESALRRYVSENPRSARPEHRYSTVGEKASPEFRAAFAKYQGYFGVPSED
jgi:hypothetical protein